MATLFLICGLPGAGKTTLARQLEHAQPALRLCPDEWIVGLLADLSNSAEARRSWTSGGTCLNHPCRTSLGRGRPHHCRQDQIVDDMG